MFFLVLLLMIVMATGGYALSRIPLPEADPLLQTTFVCAADVSTGCNRENSLAPMSGGEDRVSVTWEEVPPVLVDAVISAEDRDFFEHNGVMFGEPIAIQRVGDADANPISLVGDEGGWLEPGVEDVAIDFGFDAGQDLVPDIAAGHGANVP